MARIIVRADGRSESGGTPLLFHNPRLSDPLDPFTREIAKISRKRGKTEADHLEMALLEFVGGLYHDGADEWLQRARNVEEILLVKDPTINGSGVYQPYIPAHSMRRSIQEAAKKHKQGKSIERGLSPIAMKAPVKYEGPTDIDELWQSGRFALRKHVGIQGKLTQRTRAVLTDWQIEFEFEIDLNVLDPEQVDQFAKLAGRYEALGDYRSGGYGRFLGSAMLGESTPTSSRKKVAA